MAAPGRIIVQAGEIVTSWIKYIDDGTGCAYYYDAMTGRTTWKKPKNYVLDDSTIAWGTPTQNTQMGCTKEPPTTRHSISPYSNLSILSPSVDAKIDKAPARTPGRARSPPAGNRPIRNPNLPRQNRQRAVVTSTSASVGRVSARVVALPRSGSGAARKLSFSSQRVCGSTGSSCVPTPDQSNPGIHFTETRQSTYTDHPGALEVQVKVDLTACGSRVMCTVV